MKGATFGNSALPQGLLAAAILLVAQCYSSFLAHPHWYLGSFTEPVRWQELWHWRRMPVLFTIWLLLTVACRYERHSSVKTALTSNSWPPKLASLETASSKAAQL